MNYTETIRELKRLRSAFDVAIASLEDIATGSGALEALTAMSDQVKPTKRRGRPTATRRKRTDNAAISERMKAYWAKRRAAKQTQTDQPNPQPEADFARVV